jgi:uncharacterized protein Yka (UPF0111/DUF47 family)
MMAEFLWMGMGMDKTSICDDEKVGMAFSDLNEISLLANALASRLEGMKSANACRGLCGEVPDYLEEDFQNLSNDFMDCMKRHAKAVGLLRKVLSRKRKKKRMAANG